MSELQLQPTPVITPPTLEDVESYRRMQARGWLDAYPNEEAGVSQEWVEQITADWLTPEALEESRGRVAKILEDPNSFLYVAKVGEDSVGMVNTTNVDGNQRLEAIYIDKNYYGTGLAQELLETGLSHLDLSKPVELEVIAYNDRAQAFYRRNGFEIVPGSEHFYKEVMPSLKMVRPGRET